MPKVYSPDKCFFELSSTCSIRGTLLDYARGLSDDSWSRENLVLGHPSAPVPAEMFTEETVVNYVIGAFKLLSDRVRLIRIEGGVFQTFRTDPNKQLAFCSLLDSGVNTKMLYGVGKFNSEQLYVESVPLNPDQYYLLNLQLKHAVYNPDTQYMLVITVKDVNPDPNITRQEATVNFSKLTTKLINEGI